MPRITRQRCERVREIQCYDSALRGRTCHLYENCEMKWQSLELAVDCLEGFVWRNCSNMMFAISTEGFGSLAKLVKEKMKEPHAREVHVWFKTQFNAARDASTELMI